ncbi:ATP-binding protein [Facilibium subflavum]|uniref:ATP-binding protein n=1 Tax=Facilibium subflavum TaxID=2219058 RepID=UPI0013C366D2|nr:ATP-binding protein [Facilibium subflavum]
MLEKVGIRGRMILLTIVPTLTVSLLLGFYFISMRFSDLERNLYIRGESIATELVAASEYGLYLNNKLILQNITDSILSYQDVSMAAVYNADGKLLTFSGRIPQITDNFFIQQQNLITKKILVFKNKDSIQFIAPVIARSLDMITGKLKQVYEDNDQRIGWIAVTLSQKRTIVNQYQAIIATLLIALIGLTISILFGLRLGGDLINPLFVIINAVKRIRDGFLDTQVHTNPPGEMKVLEEGINNMAFSLRNSHQEMQRNVEQATANLRKTLKMIETQNVQLDQARKEAIEASQIKSKFLANMSHEIRTPMNGILGFLELLNNSKLTSTQKEYVYTISQSSKHLLRIINDILDFSKIESGSLVLEQHTFDILKNIEDSIMLFKPQVIAKQLEFALFVDPQLPLMVIGDPLRFAQILTNLTGNALKFTQKGGITIDIHVRSETKNKLTLAVAIRDTGIGLSKEQKVKLFNAFTQADLSTSRKYGGTGLGLTISKNLIEQMGGEIDVDSQLGEGACFSFYVNLGCVDKKEAAILPDLHQKQVVVFDQTRFAGRALVKSLAHFNIAAKHFQNDPALIDYLAEKHHIDFIFLCYNTLPEAKKLYQSLVMDIQSFSHAKIILYANAAESSLADLIQAAKIDTYLSYPFRQSQLEDILLLRQQRLIEHKAGLSSVPKAKITKEKVQQYKVLAVDDNQVNLKLLKVFLENQELNVYTATSGAEALDLVKSHTFDMIMTDVQMPEMDGIELCQKIHDLPSYQEVPIVAITADVLEGQDKQLLESGFDAVQIKPVDGESINTLIKRFLHVDGDQGKSNQQQSQMHDVNKNKSTDGSSDQMLIDMELGAQLAGGDGEFAQEMLQALMKTLPKDIRQIKQAYQEKNAERLKALVHKLHGGCSYCGVPMLKKAASDLEKQLKQDNKCTEKVGLYYQRFIDIAEKTLQAAI